MNNPLMYNDPNGEFFVFLGLGVLFWKAVIIGAAVGLASYTLGLAVTGNLSKWSIGGALKATFFGAVGGAATFGIGSIFSSSSGTLTAIGKALGDARILVQGAAHAISQGTLSLMQGGSFWSGAAAGFLGHMGGELWGATMNGVGLDKFAKSTMGMVTFGAISGGVGAELSGGNFWQGAVTGGIVAGLNSAMHKIKTPLGATTDGNKPKEDSYIMKKLKEGSSFGLFGTDPESLIINRVGINFVAGVNNINDTFYYLDANGVGRASFRTTRTLYMSVSVRYAGTPINAQKIFAKAIDLGLDALSLKVKLQEGIFTAQEMDVLLKNSIDLNLRFEKGSSSFQAPFGSLKGFMYSNWRGSWF